MKDSDKLKLIIDELKKYSNVQNTEDPHDTYCEGYSQGQRDLAETLLNAVGIKPNE